MKSIMYQKFVYYEEDKSLMEMAFKRKFIECKYPK